MVVPVRLSIVIPTLGRPDSLRRVLERLDRQDVTDFEVLVVRDARDTSGSPRIRSTPLFPLRELVGHEPGASAARNDGWRAASAPLVLFLGDDILPRPGLVGEHLAWHEGHPEPNVGVLGLVKWARDLRVTPFMRWLETGIQFDYSGVHGIEAGWGRFYTANVSVKRSLLERVDGFDERFGYLYEDTEIAYRMSQLGFRLLLNRAALGEHLHATTLEDYRRRVSDVAVAERRFVEKHPDISPYFYELFREAARQPRVTETGAWLARFVPRRALWIGPRLWSRIDRLYRQQLAGDFLTAWDAAAGEEQTVTGSP
jgi:GT2 family glycosyltransferase